MACCMKYISGLIFHEHDFIEGYVGYEDGIIQEIGKGRKDGEIKGTIIPTFVNAHTHIGDSIVKKVLGGKIKGTIEELVKPPNGLKHRILREAEDEEIVGTMSSTIDDMLSFGISCFWDFREMGLRGVKQLYRAQIGSPIKSRIFGRPQKIEYCKDEMEALLKVVDGIGVSCITDWDYSELEKVAKHAKKEGKLFSLHASEAFREDIDLILDLNPDFLIHMTKANDGDLEICADNDIPIVVCPRSNAFFGLMPDIKRMLKKGLTVALGTDNVMIASPSLFDEMRFLSERNKLYRLSDDQIFNLCLNSRKLLNPKDSIGFKEGYEAELLVLDISTSNIPHHILHANSRNIKLICMGNWEETK